ncbi:MAG: hypothetical protein JRM80_13795 [Nitrososphaerota archaeon]|nr:hypothetical protein [Nitrososphaerota archaeon]
MKGKTGPVAEHLRPILDTYMDSAVAVVGCTSSGIARYSCEFDVLVVGSEKRQQTSIRIGDEFVDLMFTTEKEVLKPASPEHALALAWAKPVRDTSLILSTSSAASSATLSESAAKASRTRLASSLKSLGRAEVALAKKNTVDADFWLLASAYEFGYAWLLSKEVPPSPSHLLAQLRSAKGAPRSFEGVSIGGGLEAAGRAGCGARLEGLGVLHDLLREGSRGGSPDSRRQPVRTQILTAKAGELITRVELAECYSFLGQELVDGVMELLRLHPKKTLTTLTSGKDRLLGERLVRQLGLARTEDAIRSGLEVLKGQVGALAKS